MELIDFNDCLQNKRMYGGLSGAKVGVVYKDENYLIKYPKNIKNANMKNVVLSYSNSPTCEYLGSNIYKILKIPVHETILGTRRDKIVVACKDFLNQGDRLYEFCEIKTTFEPHFVDDNGETTNGDGTDLNEVLLAINEHPLFKDLPDVEQRFWDMFIIDAYIGNSDRNNGNWGVILRYDNTIELAPVYDNGGCLNNKWDDMKMKKYLQNEELFEAQAYKGVVCSFTENEKRINPFKFLATTDNKKCLSSLNRLCPLINRKKHAIYSLFDDTIVLTDTQKEFYKKILEVRLDKGLKPIYEKNYSI